MILGGVDVVTDKLFVINNQRGSEPNGGNIRLECNAQKWWIGTQRLSNDNNFCIYNASRSTHPFYITENDEVYINGHKMTF